MVKMGKKVIACLLSVCILSAVGSPAFAAPAAKAVKSNGSGIHVMYTNTDNIDANLNFSGERAECSGCVEGKSGTSKITAKGVLKQKTSSGTRTVKTWTESANGDTLYFDKSHYVAGGHEYEFEITAKVYRNGTVETVSASDSDYCYG